MKLRIEFDRTAEADTVTKGAVEVHRRPLRVTVIKKSFGTHVWVYENTIDARQAGEVMVEVDPPANDQEEWVIAVK
jgi:hypothetical protein